MTSCFCFRVEIERHDASRKIAVRATALRVRTADVARLGHASRRTSPDRAGYMRLGLPTRPGIARSEVALPFCFDEDGSVCMIAFPVPEGIEVQGVCPTPRSGTDARIRGARTSGGAQTPRRATMSRYCRSRVQSPNGAHRCKRDLRGAGRALRWRVRWRTSREEVPDPIAKYVVDTEHRDHCSPIVQAAGRARVASARRARGRLTDPLRAVPRPSSQSRRTPEPTTRALAVRGSCFASSRP